MLLSDVMYEKFNFICVEIINYIKCFDILCTLAPYLIFYIIFFLP